MSDAQNQLAISPPTMNDSEERRKLLSESLDTDDDDDASQTGSTISNTPTVESRKRAPRRGGLSGLRQASRQTQETNPVNNPTPSTNTNGNMPTAGSQNTFQNPGSNQLMGGNNPKEGGGIQIQGTNIGSKASEPQWTNEQAKQIADAIRTTLTTVPVPASRVSIADPENKYLVIGQNDSVVTRAAAVLPNIGWGEFKLGLGQVKADQKTGKARLYSDVVMKGPNWTLTQWTSKFMIVESVPANILNKPPRMTNGRPERRIGHDFVRIGLAKICFAPVFETLRKSMPTILDANSISQTSGFYWLNASWGVTGSPGKFTYKAADRQAKDEFNLYRVMQFLGDYSSYGMGTIAISIGNESRVEGGKLIPDGGKYELSVKIHNMMHMKKTTYHSPPQSASAGFEVSDDIFAEAEILDTNASTVSTFDATSSAFSGGGANPFFGVSAAVGENQLPGVNSTQLL